MRWRLSRFRAGDLVEVCSHEEILATLDEHGRVDEMPFMPEMLQFCGRRFRVGAVAHKTCDTARQTWKGRRLNTTVHLVGARCDGSAHDGCQAECNLFWKDVWIKPVSKDDARAPLRARETKAVTRGCTESDLMANVRSTANEGDVRHCCQATKMWEATSPLPWWDVRQYVFDVVTRNHSLGRVLRVTGLATLRYLLPRVPFGYRWFKSFHDWMHRTLTGREAPRLNPGIKAGMSAPAGRLDLKPGEWVRIKSQGEIEKTLNERGRHRGLSFDHEEMAAYCGRVFRVRRSVMKLIDEPTGKMLQMKQPCIMLDGVVCIAEYANCRLNCPRQIPSYWRELWLERVAGPAAAGEECPTAGAVQSRRA